MSTITLFKRWTFKKKYFWLVIGLGVPVLCILSFLVVSFFGLPLGGRGYSDEYFANDGFAMSAPMEMPAAEGMLYEEEMTWDKATDIDQQSMAIEAPDDISVANSSGAAITDRLIIREGNITISVNNTLEVRDKIDEIVAELASDGAYVVTSSESGRGDNRQPYINMVIRVPVQSFSFVMDQIAEMGVRVDERWENAQDVTDEYVDLEGRIEALEISIERLQGLMRDAAFTEDLLYAEEQLSRREAELEGLKGRLNYLAESAALSRINIGISPYELSEPIDTSWKPAETFRRAVENLVESLQDFADFMIIFLIAVAPWLVLVGLVVWGVVAAVRRRRKKKAAQAE
ncbi:MAG: DUF4349 domain-containing protein [Anaerolineales bacterium]|nr:DUF4349 domain-containing protein [Anaerolineales bacterium]